MSTAVTKEAAALCKQAREVYGGCNGRLVAAIEIWQQALQIDPGCDQAQKRLHYVLQEQQAIIEEIQSLDIQLRESPDKVAFLYRTAYLMFVMGHDQEAQNYWQKVIEKDDGSWAKSARKMLRKKLGIAT